MLFLIYGENDTKRRAELDRYIEKYHTQSRMRVAMSDVDFRRELLEMIARGDSLFNEQYTVVLSGVLDNEQVREAIFPLLKNAHDSSNCFLFIERTCTKEIVKKFEKAGAEIVECAVTAKIKNDFSIFALADAVGARDRKNAWILLNEALDRDIAPEEVHGVIFWEIKTLLLAHPETKATLESSGLNPYVFKKAHAMAKGYTIKELKEMSEQLVALYHDAHRGLLELSYGLESFLLSRL